MEILLANPRGFCAGVDRAISIVQSALEKFGPPIYVRHEVVHNRFVVNQLRAAGAVFVEELSEIPDHSIAIFSAHGVAKSVREEAKVRPLKVFDATCPLVSKVHMEVHRASLKGKDVVLIGHAGHIEVIGTMGQYENPEGGMYLVESVEDVEQLNLNEPQKACYVTQTTLSVDETRDIVAALRMRYPTINGPRKDDICYATQNRQDVVRDLSSRVDLMLVVGSSNSSNANRLRELAENLGTRAYLIDDASRLEERWFIDVKCVGVTAGASTPEVLIQGVIEGLLQMGGFLGDELQGTPESVVFELPAQLR